MRPIGTAYMKSIQLVNGVYMIDFSGPISLETGISNISLIENEIRKLFAGEGTVKLLCDMRNMEYDSRRTHDTLSRFARAVFTRENLSFTLYFAILTNDPDGTVSEHERWFTRKTDAAGWLSRI